MKLLFCDKCSDVFKLVFTLQSCECGQVSGKYIDIKTAVVNGKGYSIAIGNGSLMGKCGALLNEDLQDRDHYFNDFQVCCWIRPHEGQGNPHTHIDKNLGKEE